MHKSTCIALICWLMVWWVDVLAAGGPVMVPCVTLVPAVAAAEGKAPVHPILAQGILLIAAKNLLDPHFARTVILLTDYDDNGAAGLVLNRRTNLTASQVLPQFKELVTGLDTIHIGGPIAVNHIRLLIMGDTVPEGARRIIDNIFMINTVEDLKQLGSEHLHKDDTRLYMGYAGWGPGQLEMELLRGDWYTWPASSELIFSNHPENIWNELVYLATATWI